MVKVPDSHADLLADFKRAFAYLATLMPDGSPQLTPVWFDVEGETIRINTARGRVKDRNMTARPRVALLIQDPADPYRYLQIRGQIIKVTEEGAREHIDRLSMKYTGKSPYTLSRPDERRVTYTILPRSLDAH